jgi:hypothetical protein
MFFYDKIARNKEEFNILICSRSRIMNLDESHISNIDEKTKILKLLQHIKATKQLTSGRVC